MTARELAGYVAGRFATAAGLLVLLSVVVYAGVDLLPGDPATARLGGTATPAQIAEAQERLGLDRPLAERFLSWAGGVPSGDLGTSAAGAPVSALLGVRLGNSAVLVAVTFALLVPLSLALGVALGRRAGGRLDRFVSPLLILSVAVPEFVTAGVLVLVLAVGLGWFPAVSLVPAGDSPLAHPEVLALPVASLLLVSLGYATRIVRAATAAAATSAHVEFMRLNGIAERVVLRQAILPAVLPAAVQVWTLGAAVLLGGTILVEKVFGYPGIGDLLVRSVQSGDLPVVQALALLLGAVTLLAMTAADVAGRLLVPGGRG